MRKWHSIAASLLILTLAGTAAAGVLPEDRTDILYHLYDGGGVTIDGPSLLMRKQVGKNVSVVGNYYVDMVSSASIDVVTTASPYTEERTQYSVGMDYLHRNTTMSLGYTSSSESDFDATTWPPAPISVATARCSAAWPEAVAMAPTPPSSAAMRSSRTATVGLEMRE